MLVLARWTVGAIVVAALASAAPAWAQTTGDEATAVALSKFDEGRALFEQGDFAAARERFAESYRVMASPNSRLYMARCDEKLGKIATAYVGFRLAAREAHDRMVAGDARYKPTREAAVAEEGDLEPRVPWLTIAVPGGVPDDFAVTANGVRVEHEAWGAAVPIDPGQVVVVANGHRLVPFRAAVDLREGDRKRVDVPAKRVPTSFLRLRFAAKPLGLWVNVDGRPVEAAALDGVQELDAGEHVVRAGAPGDEPFEWKKSLDDGETADVRVELQPHEEVSTIPVRLELGTRLSDATPLGNGVLGHPLGLGDVFVPGISTGIRVGAEAGIRIASRFSLGAFIDYAWLAASCESAVTCAAHDLRYGLRAGAHLNPRGKIDPWVSLAFSIEDLVLYLQPERSSHAYDSAFEAKTFLPVDFSMGVDLHVRDWAGIGPYVGVAAGDYDNVAIISDNMHVWIDVGLRATFEVWPSVDVPER